MIKSGWKLENYIEYIGGIYHSISDLKVKNGIIEKDITVAATQTGKRLIRDRLVFLKKIDDLMDQISNLNKKIFKSQRTYQLISEKKEEIKNYDQQAKSLTEKIDYISAFCAKFFKYKYYRGSYIVEIDKDIIEIPHNKAKYDQASDKIWEMFLEVYKDKLDIMVESIKSREADYANQQKNIDDILDNTL